MTWDQFEKLYDNKKSGVIDDKEYDDIFYENKKCMIESLSIRDRKCPMFECR